MTGAGPGGGRWPAVLASLALHAGVFALLVASWDTGRRLQAPPPAVPVSLVATGPTPDVRAAVKAEAAQTSQTPEPQAQAPPQPLPPAPQPRPEPSPPRAAPRRPPPPSRAFARAQAAAPPEADLNLDQLASSLPKPSRAAARPAKPSLDPDALVADLAPRASGPTRAAAARARPAETDVQARPAVGAARAVVGSALGAIGARLERLWNPNCGVEGAARVKVRIQMVLSPDGRLAQTPRVLGDNADPVWQAAAQRALTAVARGQPYFELPRDQAETWAGKPIPVNFDAEKACSSR